ncbi:MAG: hypothetical protein L3J35_09740 [Bacteroidales bacterium]|nr:hypothetical protein [Bacteroidales bacterium]
MKFFKIISTLIFLILFACKSEKTDKIQKTDTGDNKKINTELVNASDSAVVIADSIMYITNVINPEPSEEYYMKDWLGGAKTEILANHIFKAVYDGKLKAYEYTTGKEMTIEEVKELDSQYSRKDIGQILFTEDWYFDEKQLKMYKQVNSIMLAYFRYDDEGNIIGNKAGIRVYLNGTKPMRGALDY